MIRSGISFSAANTMILGSVLLAFALTAAAQRHGGGGMGGGGLSANGHPSGVKEDDTLRDFHQAMALQATSQQTAAFQALIKDTEAAKAELQTLLERLHAGDAVAEPVHRDHLDRAVENARNGNKKFEQGFSAAQKAGLREIAKRLAKADSEVELEAKKLDQSVDAKISAPELAARAESLDKALTDFYSQQLALGREMSITLASGQDVAFTLPAVSHPVSIANRTVGVPVSGALQQTASQGVQRTFKLELAADLSDLQQNITEILRAQLNTAENCGQRVAIKRATLEPSIPTSLVLVQLHFERWTCSQMFGQQTSNELAEEDGTVEIKLTPAVEKPNLLTIAAAFGRINATGMLGESLRSGSLGDDLRETVTRTVLSAARTGSDFKISLPPAVQNSAVIQSARFQEAGVGTLMLLLEGQVEISNEQAASLASQLNQALSAQAPPAR